MSKPNPQPTLNWRALSKLERRIADDERGGIKHRWEYGREVLKTKAGRRQLPDGMIADLVKAGDRDGKTISATEIRNRIRFAETYASDQQVNRVSDDLGSWSAIINAGFPEVTVDEDPIEPEDLEAVAPDAWEQMSLLPGFKPTFNLNRREIAIADATVPDVIAYRDMCREKHENYGKTVDAIVRTVDAIIDGWDGDPEMKAVDAYQRGIDAGSAVS